MRTKTTSLAVAISISIAIAACAKTPPLPPPPHGSQPVAWPPASAASAAAAPRAPTPDAPFRQHPPEASGTVAYQAPKIDSFALANGIKVLFVERHDLPIVAVRVVLRAGAGDLANVRPGVVSFLGVMLENGTDKRDALKVSDDYEAIGAEHATWVNWDSGGAWMQVVSAKLDAGLDVLSDVLLHPTFPPAEIERARARRLAALQQVKNDEGSQAFNAAAAAVFGRAHPYGHALQGQEADVRAMTRDDLVRVYQRLFVPGDVEIAVAGDVSADVAKKALEARFGAWRGAAAAARAPVPPPPAAVAGAPRVVFVDFPKASQSEVFVVDLGTSMSTKDRDALRVAQTILGGMFSSRINLNLREKNGYAYGAFAFFDMRHGIGPFFAGGSMHAEHTADAVKELLAELKRFRDQPVTDKELADAKDYIVRGLPGRFESLGAVTDALAHVIAFDLPLDEYATLPQRIAAVTVDDVRRVAQQYLRPDKAKVVIVGDRASIEPTLEQLNLGPIEARDPYGDVK